MRLSLLRWLNSLNRFFDDPEIIREPEGLYGPDQPFPTRGAHVRALEAAFLRAPVTRPPH